ncbi:hypothetical protein [Streptomyces sp. NPDC056663]|uniref:hypothetical protein n=1 Tax=Streptomyces sp. NPDC056663 TaxID=3345899 RepID=UPI0036A1C5EA
MAGALWVSEPTETASKSDGFEQPAGAAIELASVSVGGRGRARAGRVDDWPRRKGRGPAQNEEEPTSRYESHQYDGIGHQP